MLLLKKLIVTLFVIIGLSINTVISLKCGGNVKLQPISMDFYSSIGKKSGTIKSEACIFKGKNGVIQYSLATPASTSISNKWVDGQFGKDKNKRFFVSKDKKTIWVKDKPTPKPVHSVPNKPSSIECTKQGKGKCTSQRVGAKSNVNVSLKL